MLTSLYNDVLRLSPHRHTAHHHASGFRVCIGRALFFFARMTGTLFPPLAGRDSLVGSVVCCVSASLSSFCVPCSILSVRDYL